MSDNIDIIDYEEHGLILISYLMKRFTLIIRLVPEISISANYGLEVQFGTKVAQSQPRLSGLNKHIYTLFPPR